VSTARPRRGALAVRLSVVPQLMRHVNAPAPALGVPMENRVALTPRTSQGCGRRLGRNGRWCSPPCHLSLSTPRKLGSCSPRRRSSTDHRRPGDLLTRLRHPRLPPLALSPDLDSRLPWSPLSIPAGPAVARPVERAEAKAAGRRARLRAVLHKSGRHRVNGPPRHGGTISTQGQRKRRVHGRRHPRTRTIEDSEARAALILERATEVLGALGPGPL
jgi:hypothetical protein